MKSEIWLTVTILVIAAFLVVVAVAVLISGDDEQDKVEDDGQDEQQTGAQEGEEDEETGDTQENNRVSDGLYRATADGRSTEVIWT